MPYSPRFLPSIAAGLLNTFQPQELAALVAAQYDLDIMRWRTQGDLQEFYAAVVARLNERDLLASLVVVAKAERPRNVELAALAEKLGLTVSGRVVEPSGAEIVGQGLEKAVRDTVQKIDIAVLRERLGEAEQRTGLVEASGIGGFGTAFLVGPDRVMTNWHVAEPIHDGRVSPSAVRIRFDWKRDIDGKKEFRGVTVGLSATDWLVAARRYAAFDVRAPTQSDPTPIELDYAVLALAEPIGDMDVAERVIERSTKRGWFDLDRAANPPQAEEPLFLVGHPFDHPLTLSQGKVLAHVAQGRRMRHDAWSLRGSSGSPVLDGNGELCGLHHGTEPLSGEKARYNQAIPLVLVRDDLATGESRVASEASLARHRLRQSNA